MKRGEKLRERQRNIRAHVDALMQAKAMEELVLQRRAVMRIVGGTDYASGKKRGLTEATPA
jgi:hypothetical protein